MAHGLKIRVGKTHFCDLYFALNAATTLTSSVDRRWSACPGERVTYTCTLTQVSVLDWTAEPFISTSNRLQFSRTTLPRDRVLACSNHTSVVKCTDLDYTATITSITAIQNGFADMVSTFTFTASARVNGTVVQCRGLTVTEHQTASHTLNVTGGLSTQCILIVLWWSLNFGTYKLSMPIYGFIVATCTLAIAHSLTYPTVA